MGIYIDKMEMPLDVPGNETIIRIQPNGEVLDQYGHHLAITAVPISPHGRLGDLEKLSECIKVLLGKAEDDGFNIGVWWYTTFLRYIEFSPTIIPAEEGET